MRNIFTSLFATLLCISTSFGQGTTLEEYNYITKGYKIQTESGLDMKKGYTLTDLGTWGLSYAEDVQRKTEFKALTRDGENLPCAIMMIYKKTPTGSTFYFCIPNESASADIWKLTWSQMQTDLGENATPWQAVTFALMRFSSMQTAN